MAKNKRKSRRGYGGLLILMVAFFAVITWSTLTLLLPEKETNKKKPDPTPTEAVVPEIKEVEKLAVILDTDTEMKWVTVYDVEAEKEAFTAQKLYNITITLQSREEVTEEGQTYNREIYVVEYMIRQNNGTFRTDVGSDAIRKQLVVVTDREGEMKIDTVSSVTYSYS